MPALRSRVSPRSNACSVISASSCDSHSAISLDRDSGAHGRFWEIHDGIYGNQDRLGLPLLFALVGSLKLSQLDLRNALASRQYAPKVRADFLGGVRSGVNGTPTFFIDGQWHDGSYAFEDLAAAIDMEVRKRRVSGT